MMDSVFTPVRIDEFPNTLKISSSSQEWCGNTYQQLNLNGNQFDVTGFSYFETEGDRKFYLDKGFLEDEIWTRIRLAPYSLPVGKIKIIPGAMVARLMHRQLGVESAVASLEPDHDNNALMKYKIQYPAIDRTLQIKFQANYPYEIVSWEETYKSGFGNGAKVLTTKAHKNKLITSDYWRKHNPLDRKLRKELGL